MSPYQPRHAAPPGSTVSPADAVQASRAIFAAPPEAAVDEPEGAATAPLAAQPATDVGQRYGQAPLWPNDELERSIILPPAAPAFVALERTADDDPTDPGFVPVAPDALGERAGGDGAGYLDVSGLDRAGSGGGDFKRADFDGGGPERAAFDGAEFDGTEFDSDDDLAGRWAALGSLEEAPGQSEGRIPQPAVARGPMLAAGVALLVFGAVIIGLSLHFNGGKPPRAAAVAGSTPAAVRKPAATGAGSHGHPGAGPRTSAPAISQPGVRTRGAHGKVPAKPSAHRPAGAVVPAQAATATAVNLAVPSDFGPVLRNAWVAGKPGGFHLTPLDVRSTLPGTVFYAAQPAIGVYWAVSSFVPSGHAQTTATGASGKALVAQFGKVAVFFRHLGQSWAYLGASPHGTCPGNVPQPVYTAWGICESGLRAPVGS